MLEAHKSRCYEQTVIGDQGPSPQTDYLLMLTIRASTQCPARQWLSCFKGIFTNQEQRKNARKMDKHGMYVILGCELNVRQSTSSPWE